MLPPMKAYSITLKHHCMMIEKADGVDDGVVQPGLVLGFAQPRLVRLQVDEVQRIGRLQLQIDQLEARFEQTGDTLPRAQSKVLPALGADLQVRLQIGLP